MHFRLESKLLRLTLNYFLFSVLILSCNQNKTPDGKEKPEDNRFTKRVLMEGFDEPMAMTFLNDGHVLIVERKGGLKSFNTKTNQLKLITTIPVNTREPDEVVNTPVLPTEKPIKAALHK